MDKNDDFITPPAHTDFKAKQLFGECGYIKDGAIAYLMPGGGGPEQVHTHPHNHLFIVVKGCVKVILGEEEKVLHANESLLVDGNTPHSVWNCGADEAVIVGISVVI